MLMRMALRLFSVNVVQSLGLNLAVHESTNEAGKDLLGLSVAIRLA